MKPRILLYVLIISVMPIIFVSDTNTQVTVLPDIPLKAKICVFVPSDDNTHLDERLESFIRRELRALGDVDLVRSNSDWDYLLAYRIHEITRKSDNTKNGWLSIAEVWLSSSALLILNPVDFSSSFGRPGYLRNLSPAHWHADRLHQYAIESIGNFDKVYLEPLRIE